MWAFSRTIEAGGPGVVPLEEQAASRAELGAKAANLARARAAGLPVVEGFVIPPRLAARIGRSERGEPTAEVDAVRAAWGSLSNGGSQPVVVRSSSLAEDTESASLAGVFDSIVDVHGWDDFLDAVRTVATSADRAPAGADAAPLAVLVQLHVDPWLGGVMFGADPVTGRADRLVVAVVEGGPQALVAGSESGARVVLDRHGRLVEATPRRHPLRRRQRAALARLARRVEGIFGGPQDVEWAITDDGRLLLLQSRPITAIASRPEGPVLGPGPVAETFPVALRPLEEELWLTPLREALRVVLQITGGAPRRMLERSPIVLTIGGRAAVDLELLEHGNRRRRGAALLDPRPPARRLRVAWRVGRLRSALPALTADVIAGIDRDLQAVPDLDQLGDDELLVLLRRSRAALRAAHGYELLAGTLGADDGTSGASVALAALFAGRRAGLTDAEIAAADPSVLALTHPAIGPAVELPDVPIAITTVPLALGPREALRLRIRWLHELTSRAASTLGARLATSGTLAHPSDVARLDMESLARAVGGDAVELAPQEPPSPPLPARFRLAGGIPVAVGPTTRGEGTGAGGGRGVGRVVHDPGLAAGSVLVVGTLDPRLAAVLPGLSGLVAETGNPLSHLAILAREHGVPTVVGVPGALGRFPTGSQVVVDGTSGEVRIVDSETVTP